MLWNFIFDCMHIVRPFLIYSFPLYFFKFLSLNNVRIVLFSYYGLRALSPKLPTCIFLCIYFNRRAEIDVIQTKHFQQQINIKSQSHIMPPYSQMVSSASQQLLYYLQHLSLHWHGSVESDILLHRPLQISQINKTSSQQSSHSEHESLH